MGAANARRPYLSEVQVGAVGPREATTPVTRERPVLFAPTAL